MTRYARESRQNARDTRVGWTAFIYNGGSRRKSFFSFWLWRGLCEPAWWRFALCNMSVAIERAGSNELWPQVLQTVPRGVLSKVIVESRLSPSIWSCGFFLLICVRVVQCTGTTWLYKRCADGFFFMVLVSFPWPSKSRDLYRVSYFYHYIRKRKWKQIYIKQTGWSLRVTNVVRVQTLVRVQRFS